MDKKTSLIREFERVTSLEYKEIGSHLPGDRIPIGFFCPYVPEELIYAAGALPFRLMGAPARMSHVQAHLQPGCCHLVKSSFEIFLRGELDFLKGIIFSHTCDTMQGLSDIWAFQKRLSLQFNLMMPTNLNSETSRPYWKAEIERFKGFLETNIGEVTLQNLTTAIQLFNRIRENIRAIYQLRRTLPDQISEADFANIIRVQYLMDRNQYHLLLSELLDLLSHEEKKEGHLVPIYLAGNMVHSAPYFSLIEEAGGTVVLDDLCSGARFLRLMTREDIDPIEALTQRYFSSFLCPTKHGGSNDHIETLIQEVEGAGATGVIFLFYKYCESHYFDYPDLKTALEAKSIPTLLLEVDDPATSQGQLKIRIQAFIEMLSPF
ncbi:MAG: 2-hydroxyacyl-CoA dehydratase family protein [Desulfobacterales bacterium]|nr:2-hydroxyacyl-CoA dehydratase family protein [Desulfobacterales bacterium]